MDQREQPATNQRRADMQAIFSFILIMMTTVASAQVCTCDGTDAANEYITVNPDDNAFKDEFPWQIVSCEPVYDMRDKNEPLLSFKIKINLVAEDNPLIESYTQDTDGNAKVWKSGDWIRFDTFERSLTIDSCSPLTS